MAMPPPQIPEHPRVLLAMEKEMTGVYISGHPLGRVQGRAAALHHHLLMFGGGRRGRAGRRTPEVEDGQMVEMAHTSTRASTHPQQ